MQYCKVIMCSYVISGFRNWLVAGIRTEKQYMYRSRVPASREMSGGGGWWIFFVLSTIKQWLMMVCLDNGAVI